MKRFRLPRFLALLTVLVGAWTVVSVGFLPIDGLAAVSVSLAGTVLLATGIVNAWHVYELSHPSKVMSVTGFLAGVTVLIVSLTSQVQGAALVNGILVGNVAAMASGLKLTAPVQSGPSPSTSLS